MANQNTPQKNQNNRNKTMTINFRKIIFFSCIEEKEIHEICYGELEKHFNSGKKINLEEIGDAYDLIKANKTVYDKKNMVKTFNLFIKKDPKNAPLFKTFRKLLHDAK
ncbi:MAG: hypothetical protein ACQES9_14010 [Myxococcota bacterium]